MPRRMSINPTALGDRQVEHDDASAHQNDGDGMAEPPEDADQSRMADALLAADDGGHGDHVIRVGRVPDAQQETKPDDREQRDHIDRAAGAMRQATITLPAEPKFSLEAALE